MSFLRLERNVLWAKLATDVGCEVDLDLMTGGAREFLVGLLLRCGNPVDSSKTTAKEQDEYRRIVDLYRRPPRAKT